MLSFVNSVVGSPRKRIFSLAFLDGVGTGIQGVVVGIVVAQRFGLSSAGLVLGLLSLGRFFSPAVFWFVDRHPRMGNKETHRLFQGFIVGMTVMSVAVVLLTFWGEAWMVVLAGLIWSLCNSSSSIIATSAVPDAISGFGPWSMVGTAAGAFIGAWSAGGGDTVTVIAVVALVVVLALQLLEIPLIASVEFEVVSTASVFETLRHAGKGFILSSLTYGPLIIYPALVVAVASANWVGVAMAAYAAGALVAIPLSRRLTGFNSFAAVLLLGAVGVGVWMFALSGPLIIISRFFSGMILFVAQGRLLRVAYGTNGSVSTARLAGSSTGLGVGASVGAIVAAQLAEGFTVTIMAAVLFGVTVVAAGVVVVAKKLRFVRS